MSLKIGDSIKGVRNSRGLTQQQLADYAGISRSYLADIERDRYNPSLNVLRKISVALNVPFDRILTNKPQAPLKILQSRLKELREQADKSIEEIAQLISIESETYKQIEAGEINPSMEVLDSLASLYNCTIDYLTGLAPYDPKMRISSVETVTENEESYITRNLPLLDNVDVSQFFVAPILGNIQCGQPTFADSEILGYMYVDSKFSGASEKDQLYYLKVEGDSMTPKYQAGDLVLIRQQPIVDNGDVAAVLIDGEDACLKKVYITNGDVWLHSTNPAYEPQKIPAEKLTILGKALLRLG